jgi:hypothetical protein
MATSKRVVGGTIDFAASSGGFNPPLDTGGKVGSVQRQMKVTYVTRPLSWQRVDASKCRLPMPRMEEPEFKDARPLLGRLSPSHFTLYLLVSLNGRSSSDQSARPTKCILARQSAIATVALNESDRTLFPIACYNHFQVSREGDQP